MGLYNMGVVGGLVVGFIFCVWVVGVLGGFVWVVLGFGFWVLVDTCGLVGVGLGCL